MHNEELDRLKSLYKYELAEIARNRKFICGLDEAGRGPLAGPVVSSAVILPFINSENDFEPFQGINDSKKLTARRRESIYNCLLENKDVHIGVGIVSEIVIDRINILKATELSMRRAIVNLDIRPDCLLVDGMNLPGVRTYQRKIINGDGLSLSIAAASIIAKVTRDMIMDQYHEKYPQYGFDKHKGYGTKEHFRRIREHGICKIHRRSFNPINLLQEISYE